jgi:ketosteroid isomerase-like protein
MLCALTLVSVATGSSRIAFTADADRSMVLALDATYQAAVKVNDFRTMDKLLADDFVLVTGCGKVFSKSDLLKEARSGTIHYQAQDDSDRTVRVWGDTAVITAKLWE